MICAYNDDRTDIHPQSTHIYGDRSERVRHNIGSITWYVYLIRKWNLFCVSLSRWTPRLHISNISFTLRRLGCLSFLRRFSSVLLAIRKVVSSSPSTLYLHTYMGLFVNEDIQYEDAETKNKWREKKNYEHSHIFTFYGHWKLKRISRMYQMAIFWFEIAYFQYNVNANTLCVIELNWIARPNEKKVAGVFIFCCCLLQSQDSC